MLENCGLFEVVTFKGDLNNKPDWMDFYFRLGMEIHNYHAKGLKTRSIIICPSVHYVDLLVSFGYLFGKSRYAGRASALKFEDFENMEVGTPLLYRSGSNVISTRFVDLDICHDMLCVKIQIQDPKKGNGIQYVLEQSLSDLSLQSNPESLRIGKSLKALSEEVCRVFGSGCTNFISELYDTVGLVGSKNGILEELDSLEFKSAKFNESLEFASVSSLIRPQNIPLYEDSPFSFIYSDGKVGSRSQLNTEEILCFRGASKSLKFWDMFPCASKVFVSEAAEIHCSTLIKKFNEAYTGRSQTEFEIPFFAPDSIMFSAFISR